MVSLSNSQRLPTVSAAKTLQYTDGVHASAWLPASSLFAATPGSGGAITQVRFSDIGTGGSWFELDGRKIDGGSITLGIDQVSRLHYVAGTQPGTYRFEVAVADAQGNWSAGANGTGTVRAFAPVVVPPPTLLDPVLPVSDTVTLSSSGQTLTVTGLHTLIGGAGTDVVTLGGTGNTMLMSRIETLIGSVGTDVVTLGGAGNTMLMSGIETLIGSAGVDVVKLSVASPSVMTTLSVIGIETLKGSAGIDTVLLTNGGNTMTFSAIETLIGGTGVDVVRNGGLGSTIAVSSVETLTGGPGTDVVTVIAGTIHYEIGAFGGDILTLAAGNGADEVVFTAPGGGYSQITNFQSGTDHVVLAGAMRTAFDRNADGSVAAAVCATGAVNASAQEVAFLSTPVTSLTAPGLDAVRTAIGTLVNASAGAGLLVVAGDGVGSGLYAVRDSDGNGQVAASEIRLLGLFQNSPTLIPGDIVFG